MYNIQSSVGMVGEMGKNQSEEMVITRLRIAHTGLNHCMQSTIICPTCDDVLLCIWTGKKWIKRNILKIETKLHFRSIYRRCIHTLHN